MFVLQELTEEGLPFLILFYNPDERDIIDQFQLEVARQLLPEKGKTNNHRLKINVLNFQKHKRQFNIEGFGISCIIVVVISYVILVFRTITFIFFLSISKYQFPDC